MKDYIFCYLEFETLSYYMAWSGIHKLEKTGYKPSVSLDQGISELVKGYKMIKNTRYGNV